MQESTVPAAADDDDLWPEAAGGDWPEPAAGSPRPPAEALPERPPDPEPETGGSASGGSGTVQLVQELFPGRIVSREPLNTTEDPAGMGVESEGYEYPEADETSPAGSGEDA